VFAEDGGRDALSVAERHFDVVSDAVLTGRMPPGPTECVRVDQVPRNPGLLVGNEAALTEPETALHVEAERGHDASLPADAGALLIGSRGW
jgi:hypothetical protein